MKISITGFLLCCLMLFQQHAYADNSVKTLKLHNRNIAISNIRLDPELKEALQKPGELPVQSILLLDQIASPSLRYELQHNGISLLTYLGEHIYHAEIHHSSQPQSWPDAILWAGAMAPEDKLETALWQKNFAPWAITDSGKIRILIQFRHQTTHETIQTILGTCCSVYSPHNGGDVWKAEIPADAIIKLAADPNIRHIEQGPHPMQPLHLQD